MFVHLKISALCTKSTQYNRKSIFGRKMTRESSNIRESIRVECHICLSYLRADLYTKSTKKKRNKKHVIFDTLNFFKKYLLKTVVSKCLY